MPTKKNNQEYQHFNKLSEEWWDENGKFRVLHQIRPIRIQYILDQLSNLDMKKLDILDLGCGGGLVSESLARLGANVTGVDFVENNIKVAKLHSNKKKLNIKYLNEDIEKLKIKKRFDIIEILEHLNDWRYFLLNIKKNLKDSGIIIISTINRNLISKYTAIYFAEYVLNWIPKGTHTYEKFIKPDEIEDCMLKVNFKLKNIRGLVYDPIELNWKLSKNTKINYFCTYKNSN